MPFGSLAPIAARAMDGVMTRVERGGELLQRVFLARSLGPFENDHRAPPMNDLRQLELGQMVTQRRKRGALAVISS